MLNFYFYRGQVRDYLAATGTPLGLIVFLTSNRVSILRQSRRLYGVSRSKRLERGR